MPVLILLCTAEAGCELPTHQSSPKFPDPEVGTLTQSPPTATDTPSPDAHDELMMRTVLETGGLWAVDTQAPSYRQLRPFNQPDGAGYFRLPETEAERAPNWETDGFPIHKGLSTHLLNVVEQPDPVVAHVMAICSGYAYSGPETVSMIMARMGLEENHCRLISATVDAMFICSRAFLVQSADGKVVILCYRGTEPTNPANGMTDLDVEPQRINYQFEDPCATVHAGFYRNVRVTRYEIMEALRRAMAGRSVRKPVEGESDSMPGKLEALYITGHSLGGAMASMMAVMLRHEKKYAAVADLLKGVYTFGQPMIGDPSFARACESDREFRMKVIRYIHGDDVIPHFPPVTAGPFMHFGREYRYRVSHLRESLSGWLRYMGSPYQAQTGAWRETDNYTSQMSSFLGFALGASTLAARKSQILRALPVVYSLEDHLPARYIGALTPRRVSDEFGD